MTNKEIALIINCLEDKKIGLQLEIIQSQDISIFKSLADESNYKTLAKEQDRKHTRLEKEYLNLERIIKKLKKEFLSI